MKATTLDGTQVDIDSTEIAQLGKKLSGSVLTPDDSPGYEESRTVWNAMIQRFPALVIRCVGTNDVILAVQFARKHNLPISIKGGGHNIAGLAVADGALLLDMSAMRGVWVDPVRRIAHAQPGCLLGHVDRETQLYGLAAVLGFVSQTGIAGLTLGGGFGYLTRRWGWSADNLVRVSLVTADAQLVHASDSENRDLFWALKGGGGNFGVVTGFDYKLHNVGPEILGGMVLWDESDAPHVLEFYQNYSQTAPRELTMALMLRYAPTAPWIPEPVHGKPVVGILVCYSGNDLEQGEELIAPIKSFRSPIADSLVRRPYVEQQSFLDATQPYGRRTYWKSEYLPGVSQPLCEHLIHHAQSIPSLHSLVMLFHIGGALHNMEETPAGNRNAQYVLLIAGAWEEASEDAQMRDWVRSVWSDLKVFSTGGTYLNFLTADEDRTEAALSGMERLKMVKKKWDPDNVFRLNHNITPD